MDTISFGTFNLYNLNEPGLPMYRDRDGWSQAQYYSKVSYTSAALQRLDADVWGFQELWHGKSLKNAFVCADLDDDYDLLVPEEQDGQGIVCAAAVRKSLLFGEPEWIGRFPESVRLESQGDDPQAPDIAVSIDAFSRPVLKFQVKPRDDEQAITVFVCHFKSKAPTQIFREDWYEANPDDFKDHREALGSAISTIRRTAEAAALRVYLTQEMKGTDTPVIVLGDVNDGQHSNTLNILTGQPNFLLSGLQTGGSDSDLYSAQALQQYRSLRDVYYTHVFKNVRQSLDHILFSQEFYDNSRRRRWAFDGLIVDNDHLHHDDPKERGANDHGLVKVSFKYRPVRSAAV